MKQQTVKSPQKTRPLNVRERKFIKNLAHGMFQKDAAIKAGYSPGTAEALASRKIKEPQVVTAMQQALEKHGISDDRLADVIKNGIDANKVISANVISENGEGMKDANSMTKDFVEVPDWQSRHRFVDTALKLKNSYPAEQVEHTGQVDIRSIHISFVIPGENSGFKGTIPR